MKIRTWPIINGNVFCSLIIPHHIPPADWLNRLQPSLFIAFRSTMPAVFTALQAAQVFDPLAATYNKNTSYHHDDVGFFVRKATIQGKESVSNLRTGTGWVAEKSDDLPLGRLWGLTSVRR